MSGKISEDYLSRPFTLGTSPGRDLVFNVVNTEDETEVQALVAGMAPAVYLGLVLQEISAEPLGAGIWKGHAKYVGLETEWSFDTSGGSQKMTQSLGTVNSYAPPGHTAPDFAGAIGVSDDKVEGVDVPAGGFQWSETHQFEDADVTFAYQHLLASYSGRTMNNGTYKGWAAGEVNFIGCSGSKRGTERWSLTFRFAASPNATGLSVGDITGISKLGWDYLWVRYADFADTSAKCLVKRPIACYIERILVPVDYSLLLIGV